MREKLSHNHSIIILNIQGKRLGVPIISLFLDHTVIDGWV